MNKKCAKCGIDEKTLNEVGTLTCSKGYGVFASHEWPDQEPPKADERPWWLDQYYKEYPVTTESEHTDTGFTINADPSKMRRFIEFVVSESLRRTAERVKYLKKDYYKDNSYMSQNGMIRQGDMDGSMMKYYSGFNAALAEAAESIINLSNEK